VPQSESDVSRMLERLDSELSSGRRVVAHCRQGIGRTGLIAACLLVSKGWEPAAAVAALSAARSLAVPETEEQRRWIDRYAATLTGAR
jgi:protein-tyrosine phosphatase